MLKLTNPSLYLKTVSTAESARFFFIIVWLELVAIETIKCHFSFKEPSDKRRVRGEFAIQ